MKQTSNKVIESMETKQINQQNNFLVIPVEILEIASVPGKLELEVLKLINYCLTCFLKYYHADSDYGTLRPKVYIKTAKLQFGGNQYAL